MIRVRGRNSVKQLFGPISEKVVKTALRCYVCDGRASNAECSKKNNIQECPTGTVGEWYKSFSLIAPLFNFSLISSSTVALEERLCITFSFLNYYHLSLVTSTNLVHITSGYLKARKF